jgi:hypothetical protein
MGFQVQKQHDLCWRCQTLWTSSDEQNRQTYFKQSNLSLKTEKSHSITWLTSLEFDLGQFRAFWKATWTCVRLLPNLCPACQLQSQCYHTQLDCWSHNSDQYKEFWSTKKYSFWQQWFENCSTIWTSWQKRYLLIMSISLLSFFCKYRELCYFYVPYHKNIWYAVSHRSLSNFRSPVPDLFWVKNVLKLVEISTISYLLPI